jgi:hypothetical protein
MKHLSDKAVVPATMKYELDGYTRACALTTARNQRHTNENVILLSSCAVKN